MIIKAAQVAQAEVAAGPPLDTATTARGGDSHPQIPLTPVDTGGATAGAGGGKFRIIQ